MRWQYQGLAEPVSTSTELITIDKWTPILREQPVRRALCLIAAIAAGSFFTDPYPRFNPEVITSDKWTGNYPDRINVYRRSRLIDFTVTDQFHFLDKEFTSANVDKWLPTYPDRLVRAKRVAPLDFGTIDSYFSNIPAVATVTSDRWTGSYPNRLDRAKRAFWQGFQQVEVSPCSPGPFKIFEDPAYIVDWTDNIVIGGGLYQFGGKIDYVPIVGNTLLIATVIASSTGGDPPNISIVSGNGTRFIIDSNIVVSYYTTKRRIIWWRYNNVAPMNQIYIKTESLSASPLTLLTLLEADNSINISVPDGIDSSGNVAINTNTWTTGPIKLISSTSTNPHLVLGFGLIEGDGIDINKMPYRSNYNYTSGPFYVNDYNNPSYSSAISYAVMDNGDNFTPGGFTINNMVDFFATGISYAITTPNANWRESLTPACWDIFYPCIIPVKNKLKIAHCIPNDFNSVTELYNIPTKFYPTYPDFAKGRPRHQYYGSTLLDPFPLKEVIQIDKWQPTYPDRITRAKRIHTNEFVFDAYESPTFDKWQPSYPNILRRAKQPFWEGQVIIDPMAMVKNWLLDKWEPHFPERCPRKARIFPGTQWFTIDAFFGQVPPPSEPFEDYVRRYLVDEDTVARGGPVQTPAIGTEDDMSTYLRRYLQDTL